jgi:hypothetical protein
MTTVKCGATRESVLEESAEIPDEDCAKQKMEAIQQNALAGSKIPGFPFDLTEWFPEIAHSSLTST